jgi:hypothetical protein
MPALAHCRLDVGDIEPGFVVRAVAVDAAKFTVTFSTPGTSPIRLSTSSTLNTDNMACTSITLVFMSAAVGTYGLEFVVMLQRVNHVLRV